MGLLDTLAEVNKHHAAADGQTKPQSVGGKLASMTKIGRAVQSIKSPKTPKPPSTPGAPSGGFDPSI